MTADFAPSSRSTLDLALREAAAVLGSCALLPFGARPTRAKTPRERERRTVVLVHGYLLNRGPLAPLAAWLRLAGHDVISFDYRSSDGVERNARALGEFLRTRVRGGRIDLVGHSLGGLVSRAYLQLLGGARRVDRCITLGTPHAGTYAAYWLDSRVARELRPGSDVLARLEASRANAARVEFLSLVAGADTIVIPRVCAAHERVVHLPDLGHFGLLWSPRVFALVRDALALPAGAQQRAA